jgi:hypothetical protein
MNDKGSLTAKEKIIFFAVLATAAIVRLIGANFSLPNIYTTEEYKVINYALRMGNGDLNPHFFNYPSLYLYFTLFISGIYFVIGKIFSAFASPHDFALSFIKNPTGIYLTMRLISGLWSTATVAVTYLFTKELFGKRAALITMIFSAFISSIIISAHEVRPNMPSMFFVITAFYLILLFLKKDDYRYFYSAAVVMGIATSIYYNAVFLGALLPLAHFFARRKIKIFDIRLWVGLFLVPALFIVGTPFSIIDFNTFYRDFSAHSEGAILNLPRGIPAVLKHYLFVGHTGQLTPFLGLLCYAGIAALLSNPLLISQGVILMLCSIFFFSFPTAMYFSPGKGYLFPAFPMFIAAGGYLLDRIYSKSRVIFYIIFLLCFTPLVWDCVEVLRGYMMEDTRTAAGNWVEQNIKVGSKILVDMAAHSPSLKETKGQLTGLYNRAKELNHYKKEYLKLQLEAYPENTKSYEIWRIFHAPLEVSGKADIRLVLEAQKTQDLVDVSGGWRYIKHLGFKYFIYNNADEHAAMISGNPSLVKFYSEMPRNTELLARFAPKSKIYPTPLIEIRKIK